MMIKYYEIGAPHILFKLPTILLTKWSFLNGQTISVNTIETKSGIISLKSFNTWYSCSTNLVNAASYQLEITDGSKYVSPDLGTTVNQAPIKFEQNYSPGVVTAILGYQDLQDYINPNTAQFFYVRDLSCIDSPVSICEKNMGNWPLRNNTIWCLAVTNPISKDVQFQVNAIFGPSSVTSPNVDANSTTGSTTTTFITETSKNGGGFTLKESNLEAIMIWTLSLIFLLPIFYLFINF
ncbi:hypothetical protein G9A89_004999 [Geosiphon pyriformis]|nr:hypothetical protein G9A89_004999 [Geosiphon pyriformis]